MNDQSATVWTGEIQVSFYQRDNGWLSWNPINNVDRTFTILGLHQWSHLILNLESHNLNVSIYKTVVIISDLGNNSLPGGVDEVLGHLLIVGVWKFYCGHRIPVSAISTKFVSISWRRVLNITPIVTVQKPIESNCQKTRRNIEYDTPPRSCYEACSFNVGNLENRIRPMGILQSWFLSGLLLLIKFWRKRLDKKPVILLFYEKIGEVAEKWGCCRVRNSINKNGREGSLHHFLRWYLEGNSWG